jgi:hypothetical protein
VVQKDPPKAQSGEVLTLFSRKYDISGILCHLRKTIDPEKLKVARERPSPKNKHEIRSFLGPRTYYRRFISGFANIAKPPTKFTEENQAVQWTPVFINCPYSGLPAAKREVHR